MSHQAAAATPANCSTSTSLPSSFCPPESNSITNDSPPSKRQKLSNVVQQQLESANEVEVPNSKKKKTTQKDPPQFPLIQPEGFALDCPTLPNRISETKLSFENTMTLAPMVRIGSLPTRLLSLEYGADLVWGPEVIDRAIIPCERIVDGEL